MFKRMKAVRRPLFWFKMMMWALSLVIAALLIQLGSLIMSDVPTAGASIQQKDFEDTARLTSIIAQTKQISDQLKQSKRDIEDAEFQLASARSDYANGRATFENWIKTRSATESRAENPEVIARTKNLEQLKLSERVAERAIEDLNQSKTEKARILADLRNQIAVIRAESALPYEQARKLQTLKVFLFRLAITLPLLLISGWLIAKQRGSKYWPVYRGFIIFSLFAFFVELVPYLPSYGGYVRYIVGIALALLFAHFAITAMSRYVQKKQAEESKPETEKRSLINYETAVKKITAGTCPSCDRTYGAKKDQDVDFCVHCGFCLFTKCTKCGDRENSFYKFCGACGEKSNDGYLREATPA